MRSRCMTRRPVAAAIDNSNIDDPIPAEPPKKHQTDDYSAHPPPSSVTTTPLNGQPMSAMSDLLK